jgi:penicillin-binding protein 1C
MAREVLVHRLARAAKILRRPAQWAGAVAAFVLVVIGFVYWFLGPAPIGAASPSSRLVFDREGRLLRAFTTENGRWRLPVTVDSVDPQYLAMLFVFEDRRFHSHGGVDYRSMARAFWQLVSTGRPISGGSTITMQLARVLESTPTHSVKAKFRQVFRAYELEHKLTKKQILELYLKVAPFGGNVEGVRAASLAYFGKEPRQLSLAEAATLVALPQSPEQRRPDRSPEAARRARNKVLDRAAEAGVITRTEANRAKEAPLCALRHEFRALAAPDMQTGLEASAATIIVGHKTGEALAHAGLRNVGSRNYFDSACLAAINATEAERSPGLALKPLICGPGFELGLSRPEPLIMDRRVRLAGYAPMTFDGVYPGGFAACGALPFTQGRAGTQLSAVNAKGQMSEGQVSEAQADKVNVRLR